MLLFWSHKACHPISGPFFECDFIFLSTKQLNTLLILLNETGGWLPFEQKKRGEGCFTHFSSSQKAWYCFRLSTTGLKEPPLFFFFFHISLHILRIFLKSFLVSIFVLFYFLCRTLSDRLRTLILYFTKTRLYNIQEEQKYFTESIRLESISGGHLAQPCAWNWVNTALKPACGGLCPGRSWKPRRMKVQQLSLGMHI